LNNPAPVYPAISQRLGEQGKVMIRVLITKDGSPRQGEIHQSSGYERLDQAALRAVMSWHYVPGQRAGVPQDMWFNVPINFALK
jgi:protein TonB